MIFSSFNNFFFFFFFFSKNVAWHFKRRCNLKNLHEISSHISWRKQKGKKNKNWKYCIQIHYMNLQHPLGKIIRQQIGSIFIFPEIGSDILCRSHNLHKNVKSSFQVGVRVERGKGDISWCHLLLNCSRIMVKG